MPASCRLPPRAARSVAEAGPVGAASPFVPMPPGLGCDPLGPDGGTPVATGGRGGLPRELLCWAAGGGMTGVSNAFSLSGWIGGAAAAGAGIAGDGVTTADPRCLKRSG